MENPSQPYAGKAPQQRQLVEANDRAALQRFLVRMLIRVAAQHPEWAHELLAAAAALRLP